MGNTESTESSDSFKKLFRIFVDSKVFKLPAFKFDEFLESFDLFSEKVGAQYRICVKTN